jgi:hypothetical protein
VKKASILILSVASLSLLLAAGCQSPPQTAEELLQRSLAAHGGDALSDWKTMKIKGTVAMNDGIYYDAAYLLFAEKPGKLRFEQDMTADKGRLFYEYFLNDGVAWSRRNLTPTRGNLDQMQRALKLCDGIAYYAKEADEMTLKEEGVVELCDLPEGRGQKPKVVGTVPAYIAEVAIGDKKVELYFDKESYYLIQERYEETTQGRNNTEVKVTTCRVFQDFKQFGDAMVATTVQETVARPRGEQVMYQYLPYTYETVEYDSPIEQWLFEEDMPKSQ